MKRIALILIGVISLVRLATASNTISYTATAAPGALPSDGVDQNNNAVSVWTLGQEAGVTNGGISGDYFGTAFSGETLSGWQIWTSPSGLPAGDGGWIQATNTFPGGALTVGQTISINFEMRAADAGRDVGVSLLNSSTNAITFGIYGGEPNAGFPYPGNGYFYNDAGSTDVSAGGMSYQYQSEFNISFSITGPNTYTAVAGSDKWSGTFVGPLVGIEVFNDGAGNGSDVAFNNLTIAPSLSINNISPNDSTALFNATNTFSFTAASAGYAINASGVQVTLNGTNITSGLKITGAGTDNISVSYTNLQLNQSYAGQITVSNTGGAVVTSAIQFDTFSTNYYTWEAEDFDFNGGQFIDNSVISTNSINSYYNTVGISNIDEYVPNFATNQPHLWRTNDEVSIALAGETPRAQFTAAGIPDYLVGYFNPGNWLNYTRTYPAGVYNVYGRLANGNGGLANATLAQVINGQGTTGQTLQQLGMFQFTAQGWNNFNFIPLTDSYGNLLAIKLNGQTTFRVTSGSLGGGINMNFFMLVPGSNTPPAIVNIYPDGLQPFENTNALTFAVSSSFTTINQTNVQVTLNGANVSSQLAFSGSSTNWAVSLPLNSQGSYTVTITATDALGHSNTHTETFDTFSQNDLMVEADESDFNGGQWIDDSIQTATTTAAANSYYFYPGGDANNTAEYGIDYTTTNVSGETYLYRVDGNTPGTISLTADAIGTQVTSDFLRDKFINEGSSAQPPFENVPGEPVPTTNTDYNVGWWTPGTWLNYTRTFPTNSYYVYGRLAGGVPYTNTTVSLVTNGQGTLTQTTQLLGSFSDASANGFQSWHWIQLTGNNGQPVLVSLGGVETLQVTAGPGAATGNVNSHFYIFVPATVSGSLAFSLSASVNGSTVSIKFPTQSGHSYTVQYSTSLTSPNWQTLGSSITGDGTVKTATDSASGTARFYRVQAQ
jgi:hypothetical protein